MDRIFAFLKNRDLPFVARRLYGVEMRHYALSVMVIGVIEGNLASIVAKKTFDASNLLTSLVWAAPFLANMLNVLWGVLIRGRRRLPMLVLMSVGAALGCATLGLSSADWKPWGGWVFALQILLTHVFMSGLLTLRSSIWQINYPSSHRGQIVSRLKTLRFLIVPIVGLAAAGYFDMNPASYRYVYPAAAVVGLLSLLPLRQYRIRGERRELREFDAQRVERFGEQSPIGKRLWHDLREAAGILRVDRRFRRFMAAQFAFGAANFFTEPMLITVLTGQLLLGYMNANLIMHVIPSVCIWLSLPIWAPYFDRVGVVQFRVLNSALWVAAYCLAATSMILVQVGGREVIWFALPILILARIAAGTGRGGGAIAWSIGHLDFAPPGQADLYMSIHVVLTGFRALMMPALGALAIALIGNWSFLISIVISIAAFLMFRGLARDERRAAERGTTAAEHALDSPGAP